MMLKIPGGTSVPGMEEICVLVESFEPTFDGKDACRFIDGMYLGDGSTCGTQEPMPGYRPR